MLIWITLKVAIRSLWANRMRSVLAMLGIIIGVSAVIFVLSLVAGAKQQVMSKMTALGTNLLVVMPGQRGSGGVMSGTQQTLTVEDAHALLEQVPQIIEVAPVVRGRAQIKHLSANTSTTVMGSTVTYFSMRSFELDKGSYFTDQQTDAMVRVAVLGPTTATNLFGGEDPINQMIKINGVNYRVVGVTKSKGDQGWFNPDDQVIIPYTVAMKQLLGVDYVQEIDINAADEKQLSVVEAAMTQILRKRHKLLEGADDDFRVHNQAEMLSTAATFTTVLSLLAGGVASISLLVGGIGIMNIMLVTVTERTREIGVRKAIGARGRDILRQFLIEAVLMSGVGGLIGVLVGIGLAGLVRLLAANIPAMGSFTTVVQPLSVVLGLGFSSAVGVFFGYYPAYRASKLDPIEALRYE